MTQDSKSGESNVSRRSFLKSSTATVSAASLASLAIERSAHAAGDETIKIGMIGSGDRCSGAADQSMTADPSVKLVAMCDVFQSRIQAKQILAARHPEQVAVDDDHCFAGLDGYQKVIDSVDVVLIACASKFHPMYMEAAIKAGKHVFVEKPHAIDPVGIRRVEAACKLAEEKGLSVMSGLQSRWSPAWQELVKRIHDGAIGDIVAMQSMFLRGPYRLEERPEGMSETEFQFWNWYHFCWLSGDDVTQSLVHNLDRMSWTMQGEMPKWCFAVAGRSGSFGPIYGDMFDHSCVTYEYESGPRLYALCRTTHGCYSNSGDIVMGTKGTAHFASTKITGENEWRFRGTKGNPYQIEQTELIKAIKSGTPINCGSYMASSTMAAILGQIASYQGNAVTYEEAYNAKFNFGPLPDSVTLEMAPPTTPEASGDYPLPRTGITRLI